MKTLIKLSLFLVILTGITWPIIAQQGEKQFLQGMMKAEGEGNLEAAISLFSELVNDNAVDRNIRAKALLQMGICYEKLGVKQATATYEKLITEYADQTDLIAVAKRKLSQLKKTIPSVPATGIVNQELAKSITNVTFSMSPNGRYLANLGYKKDGSTELCLYDLLTKKEEFVTKNNVDTYGSAEMYLPWGAVWTRDSKKVAYVIAYSNIDRKDLRIYDLEKQEEQVLISGRKNDLVNNSQNDTNNQDLIIGRVGDMFAFSPDNQKLLFTRNRLIEGEWVHELAEITLSTKNVKVLKAMVKEPGRSIEHHCQYSPNGKYIVYENYSDKTNSTDLFVYDIINDKEFHFTTTSVDETTPFWSPKGDKIIYISNNMVSSDLMSKKFTEGKSDGETTFIMKDMGQDVNVLGIDQEGALFYSKDTTHGELFTVDLDEHLDLNPESVQPISLPTLKYGAGFARYSKDGKYVSYHTRYSETYRGYGNLDPHKEYDPALGNKYAIFIYDTNTEKTKFLDIDLYLNHWPRANVWMVPEWSYHGPNLLVNGRTSDYEGGFFEIDVETEKVRPVLTLPNSKHTNMKIVGQYMRYSKKPGIIYYSSVDWKNAVQYNMKTKEEKVIATIDDGFWFEGFSDDEETIVRAQNRFGVYEYNINTHDIKTLKEGGYPHEVFSVPSANGTHSFVTIYKEDGQAIRILDEEAKTLKELDLMNLLQGHRFQVEDKHPKKDQFLISFSREIGKNVYKLSNIFD